MANLRLTEVANFPSSGSARSTACDLNTIRPSFLDSARTTVRCDCASLDYMSVLSPLRESHIASMDSPNAFPRACRDSQHAFADPTQTLIVFDWDDTLFPTSWLTEDERINIALPLSKQPLKPHEIEQRRMDLQLLELQVERVLKAAVTHGRVIIVTLASDPWVKVSCSNFYRRIGTLLEKYDIKVVYARTLADELCSSDSMSVGEMTTYYMASKERAIVQEVTSFYAASGSSWKNIISIGDSNFERFATQASLARYSNECASPTTVLKPSQSKSRMPDNHAVSGIVDFHYHRLRCKTIKLYDNPKMKDLQAELDLLHSWMPLIVRLDAGIDVDLGDTDAVCDFHFELTGTSLIE